MKVLWITTQYPSQVTPGAGVFHKTQVDALIKQGVEVIVVTPIPQSPEIFSLLSSKYKRNNLKNKAFARHEVIDGVHVYRPMYIALPGQLKWAQPHRRIAKAIKEIIDQYQIEFDLIHSHFAMPSGGAGNIISKLYSKPYVLTLHGSDVNVYPNYSQAAMKAFKEAVQNAAKVMAVSEKLSDKTFELTKVRPSVLPIGINLSVFDKESIDKSKLRDELQLPKDKIILTYVGRLVKEKGILELMETMKQLDDRFYCLLIGDGPLKQEIENDELLKQKVHFTGQILNTNVTKYLSSSDIFILPSYSEGMPTVVIEALALKVPVICTHVGGVPDLFGDYKDLLIKPKSPVSIKQSVLDYIDNNVYSNNVIEYLHLKIINEYNVNNNSERLTEIYRNQL